MIISGGNNLKVWEWDGNEWENTQTLTENSGYNNSITSIDITSDGNMIAASSWDSTIMIWEWDGNEWEKSYTIEHTDSVKSVSFSPDNNKLISAVGGHYDATINIMEWNGENWESKYSLEGFYMTWYAAFIRNENKFVTGTGYGKVQIWEWNGPKFTDLHTLNGLELFPDSITSLDLSPDNNVIICGSMKMIKMWKKDDAMWIQLPPLTGHSSLINDVIFSPDGTKIVSAGTDIKVWEYKNKNRVYTLKYDLYDKINEKNYYSIDYNPKSNIFVTSTAEPRGDSNDILDYYMCVWEFENNEWKNTYTNIYMTMYNYWNFKNPPIFISPDGKKIITLVYGKYQEIWIWDFNGNDWVHKHSLRGHIDMDDVSSVSFTDDSNTIMTSSDEQIKIWKYNDEEWEYFDTINRPLKGISFALISPNGNSIAFVENDMLNVMGYKDNKWYVTNSYYINDTRFDYFYYSSNNKYCPMVYSKDGKKIVRISYNGEINLLDVY
jgi:WD40 repeat protein